VLNNIINYIKDFFSKVKVKIKTIIKVFKIVEIIGVIKTNAIKRISLKASFYIKYNKIIS
jgi:hypothetical protein